MEIVIQSIQVIDYENNAIYKRETPEAFSNYVRELIGYVKGNTSVREFVTRSVNTEVISCVLDIIRNQIDSDVVVNKIDLIAKRLLEKERETQKIVEQMNINIQKGSLVQALLYDEDADSYTYLLAKVEHSDFVDVEDFSFRTGFSKDKKTLWKSCIFEIPNLGESKYSAKVYSNTAARYWHKDFLELDEVVSDEINTDRAFRAIESELNRNIKNIAPRDHTVLRNSLIGYFRTHNHIDYDSMITSTFVNYQPQEIDDEKMQILIAKVSELPQKHKFDKQFTVVPAAINARVKKEYDICQGIQLKITDAVNNLDETISAERSADGNRYIKIKTDNDFTFRRFYKQQ